jgi:hypothetical protein
MRMLYFECDYCDFFQVDDDTDTEIHEVKGCSHPRGRLTCPLDNEHDPVCCPLLCSHPSSAREVRYEDDGPQMFCGDCGTRV